MKLNQKGFAISAIMYLIMVLSIIFILATLSIFTARKMVIDKQKEKVLGEVQTSTLTLYNSYDFDYTGNEQSFVVPVTGYYQLETWGASGADDQAYLGGYGGYSRGTIKLTRGTTLYINVGGEGGKYTFTNNMASTAAGGYNGGGLGHTNSTTWKYRALYGGGGATHIATSSGLLSSLSSKKDSILIVSGGGGAACNQRMKEDLNASGNLFSFSFGGSGGGYVGSGLILDRRQWTQGVLDSTQYYTTGGTQTAGGYEVEPAGTYYKAFFGQAYPKTVSDTSAIWGGGGGYYGGSIGAGGSGYIANKDLFNKSMYCYKCQTSPSIDTYTVSNEAYYKNAVSESSKDGNGFARITYLGKVYPTEVYYSASPEKWFTYEENTDGTLKITGFSDEWILDLKPSNIVIPQSIDGKKVTIIGPNAFEAGKNIGTEMSVQEIPLTSVVIPNTVTSIGSYAFSGNQLTHLELPPSVRIIEDHSFFNNPLTNVTLSNGLTTIGEYAFAYSKFTNIVLPNSLKTIERSAFSNASLQSVEIPNSVTSIGYSAFYKNNLTNIVIPESITKVGNYTFYGNKLKSVIIPNSVKTISTNAFASNQLTSVIVPNSVTSLASDAFDSGVTITRN